MPNSQFPQIRRTFWPSAVRERWLPLCVAVIFVVYAHTAAAGNGGSFTIDTGELLVKPRTFEPRDGSNTPSKEEIIANGPKIIPLDRRPAVVAALIKSRQLMVVQLENRSKGVRACVMATSQSGGDFFWAFQLGREGQPDTPLAKKWGLHAVANEGDGWENLGSDDWRVWTADQEYVIDDSSAIAQAFDYIYHGGPDGFGGRSNLAGKYAEIARDIDLSASVEAAIFIAVISFIVIVASGVIVWRALVAMRRRVQKH